MTTHKTVFDRTTAISLRAAYKDAVANGKEEFTHQGMAYYTKYAHYLLEYLEDIAVLPKEET